MASEIMGFLENLRTYVLILVLVEDGFRVCSR